MAKKVAVIGVGSAGLLQVMHLCVWLDKSWEVYAIHDRAKKILGIGESTNGGFVNTLEMATDFSLAHPEDMAALGATMKYGSRFIGWREHSWINPLLNGNVAIHFDSRRLKEFAFERLARRWPEQFRELLGNVTDLVDEGERVRVVVDGKAHHFDYVIDCRGTPPDLEGYVQSDCTIVDRCVVHQADVYEYAPYTDHIATKHGWMFGVPLSSHKSYGYLYSSQVTSKEEALADMATTLGIPEVDSGTYQAEYQLRPYYAKEIAVGRVCKNGNRALFFEPLIANSIFLYLMTNRLVFDYMVSGAPADAVNARFRAAVMEMEDLITYYYQGGSLHPTPFWRRATQAAQARMAGRKEFLAYLGSLREAESRGLLHRAPTYGWGPQTWRVVDRQLGYEYVDPVGATVPT